MHTPKVFEPIPSLAITSTQMDTTKGKAVARQNWKKQQEEVAQSTGKSGHTLRYEGITISKLEFTCSLRMTPAAHWVGVQEHMNNRKHMNAVLNSIEEKHTDEEQAAFAEKWKRACDAHTRFSNQYQALRSHRH